MVNFQRPIGAQADLKELEFISALHQSQADKCRQDGSVKDVDIAHFLRSRYAIQVSTEDVRSTILQGLGGGDEDDECIDLAELVAILLIPMLVKASKSATLAFPSDDGGSDVNSDLAEQEPLDKQSHQRRMKKQQLIESLAPDAAVVGEVLSMILRDVSGSSSPKRLTPKLLRDILRAYGEGDLADDEDLIQNMMEAARGEDGDDVMLEPRVFARALTADVSLYDMSNEVEPTTNYDDVLSTAHLSNVPADKDVKKESLHTQKTTSTREMDESDRRDLEADVARAASTRNAAKSVRRVRFAAGAIDFIAERYRSRAIVVLLWTGFVITFVAYFHNKEDLRFPTLDCSESENGGGVDFGCRIINSIITWLNILLILIVVGLGYVGLGSIGNEIELVRKWVIFIGMCVMALAAFLPFAYYWTPEEYETTVTYYNEDGTIYYNWSETTKESRSYAKVIYYIALTVGSITVFLQMLILVGNYVRTCTRNRSVRAFFTPSAIRSEAAIKKAAAHKVNAMVKNARELHSTVDEHLAATSFGSGLLNFSLKGEQYESVGGFLWVWKRIFNGELFTREGIWMSARLMAGNFAQFLISIFILAVGGYFTNEAVASWKDGLIISDDIIAKIMEILGIQANETKLAEVAADRFMDATNEFMRFGGEENCTSFMRDLSEAAGNDGVDAASVCNSFEYGAENHLYKFDPLRTQAASVAYDSINSAVRTAFRSAYPEERYMVEVPMYIATVVAFVSCIALALVYVPSVASTTLQFRSGVIPFFSDKDNFKEYRCQMDQITILLGSMFFGALYSSFLMGILIGVIVFLFVWQVTSLYMVKILAGLIGLVITVVVKLLLMVLLLRTVFAGFYRKNLAKGNVGSLILECINMGFAVGTAIARAFKLVLISVFYVGRMDTPLLARGVGVGPLDDAYPSIFRKDILAHEAHRHPYLEVLGHMYMMKLFCGDNFGRKAGYCYRLIFTVALMPWLRKYRVMARPYLADDEDEAQNLHGSAVLPTSSVVRQSAMMASVMGSIQKSTYNSSSLRSSLAIKEESAREIDLEVDSAVVAEHDTTVPIDSTKA